MSATVSCTACGAELAPDHSFCPACGVRRPQACEGCGYALPAGARFCPSCGRPAAAGATSVAAESRPAIPPELDAKFESARSELQGERREVVVVFADLSGYTAMSERMDPEEVTFLMNRVLQSLADAVYAYEGYVDKFMGDAIMALFGAPLAHENDPERAVRAGLEMLAAIERHNATAAVPLALRVGINVGEVVAAYLGPGGRLQYTVFGDAVNVASRLQAKAELNTVLVSEGVHRRLRNRFEAVALPPLELKGKSEPVRTFRIAGLRATTAEAAEESMPFVGREAETRRVREFLAETAAGRDGILIVEGEAGAGKTRLVSHAVAGGDAGLTRLKIEFSPIALPGGRPVPAAIFAQLLPEGGEAALERSLKALGRPAERHRRGLAGLVRAAYPEAGLEAERGIDPSAERQNRWLALAALLQARARERPLLLWLEDVHWIDEETAEFLAFLLPALRSAPVGFLITARLEGTGDWLPEGAERLVVRPLDEAAVGRLLGDWMDEIPIEQRRDLVRRSQGNPLFLGELVRALRESGGDVAGIPGTLQGLILSRIDRLEPPAQKLLQMAAVLGGRFPLPLLSHMYRIERQTESFDSALAQLDRRSFILLDDDGAGRFQHALIQEVAYSGILVRMRRLLHESAARLGEEFFRDRIEAEAPFFAHHFWEAGLTIEAAPHLWVAGRAAAESHDLPAAERWLGRQAEVWKEHPKVLGDREQFARFSETLGKVLLHRGELDQAEEWFRALERHGEAEDDPGWRARGLLHRGRIGWYRGRLDESLVLADRGLGGLPAGEERVAADLHNLRGLVHYYRGRADDAFAAHSEALRLRRAAEDRLGMAKSLGNIGNLLLDFRDDLDGAEEHYRQALELGEAIGDREIQIQSLNCLANVAMERGEWERACETFHRAELMLEDIGWPHLRFVTLEGQAVCKTSLGEIEAALKSLRGCLQHGDPVLEPVNRVNIRLYLFDAYLRACADRKAEEALREARRIADEESREERTEILLRQGRWLCARGRWGEAADVFREASEAARRFGLPANEELAEAHRTRAEAKAGGELPVEDPRPRSTAKAGHATLIAYLYADAAAAAGRAADARGWLARVVEEAARLGEVALERAAAEGLARVCGELGDDPAERAALARALSAQVRLAAGLSGDLAAEYESHPRNVALRERAGPFGAGVTPTN